MKLTKLSDDLSGVEEVSGKEDNQDETPATHHVHLEAPIMESASTTTGDLSSAAEKVESCGVDTPNKTEENPKQRLRSIGDLSFGPASSPAEKVESCGVDTPNKTEENPKQRLRSTGDLSFGPASSAAEKVESCGVHTPVKTDEILKQRLRSTSDVSFGPASSAAEKIESCGVVRVDTPNKTKENPKHRLRYLFHLIITKHPGTVAEINKVLQTTPNLLKEKLFFLTGQPFFRQETSSVTSDCRCDWLYESFAFLSTENSPENSNVSLVTNSLENGKCAHFSNPAMRKTGLGRPASVHLVHAAAAVGYIPVLVTLLSLYAVHLPLTHSNKLSPLDIAVLLKEESSVKVIKTFLKSLRNKARALLSQVTQCESFNELLDSIKMKHMLSSEWPAESAAELYCAGLPGVLALGGDVNSANENGTCLLQLAVRSEDPCFVLDILYYNPSAVFGSRRDNSILMDAINRDQERRRERRYIGSIALLLLDCGYDIRGDDVIYSSYSTLLTRQETIETKLRRKIVKRIEEELFCPKSLQVCCKDVLRKGLPGHTLHTYLSRETVPACLRDFVLMESRLKQNVRQCRTNLLANYCNIKPME